MAGPSTFRPLRIESVEVVALQVPLGRVFQGSHYSMNSRCTLITRLTTWDGVVGEATTATSPRRSWRWRG